MLNFKSDAHLQAASDEMYKYYDEALEIVKCSISGLFAKDLLAILSVTWWEGEMSAKVMAKNLGLTKAHFQATRGNNEYFAWMIEDDLAAQQAEGY
jgi:hypothetical protein